MEIDIINAYDYVYEQLGIKPDPLQSHPPKTGLYHHDKNATYRKKVTLTISEIVNLMTGYAGQLNDPAFDEYDSCPRSFDRHDSYPRF